MLDWTLGIFPRCPSVGGLSELVGPVLSAWFVKASRPRRVKERAFASRADRLSHIAARLEAGWRLRLIENPDGGAYARLDYGRLFRMSERITLGARDVAYYRRRLSPGR
jgi:hypothetical protein